MVGEGHALVLTKPLGTSPSRYCSQTFRPEATQEGGRLQAIYTAGVREMTRLNAAAAEAALQVKASAATDVTGFGLLGHLHELLSASGLSAFVDIEAVPRLPGVADLVEEGFVAGGTERNLDHLEPHLSGGHALTV